jgi:hypothetical protein
MSNEPTIEQMNEAICKFMGGYRKIERPDYHINVYKGPDEIEWETGKYLKYHSSFDWLMEVIIKISKLPLLNWDNTPCTDPQDVCYPRTFGMPTEDGKNVMVRFNGFSLHTAPTLIQAAHMAVYEVAEYHNKQKEVNNV